MKKCMALILLGASMIVPSAYGFFGRNCCDACDTYETPCAAMPDCGCGFDDCGCC